MQVRTLVDELADRALTAAVDRDVITLTIPELIEVPDELRRADGRSKFEPHRPDRYATKAQLEREESVLATARQTGAPQAPAERIEELLSDTRLGGDQREAVTEILGSGKRLEVLVGPAGTGKSYTVGTLVELWKEAFGTDVFGIAVSQNAVGVLRDGGHPARRQRHAVPGVARQARPRRDPRGVRQPVRAPPGPIAGDRRGVDDLHGRADQGRPDRPGRGREGSGHR